MHPLYDIESLDARDLENKIQEVSDRLMSINVLQYDYSVTKPIEDYLELLKARLNELNERTDAEQIWADVPAVFESESYVCKLHDNDNSNRNSKDADEDNTFGW